ncbi:hypothetical protein [Virgibacillus kimchii]
MDVQYVIPSHTFPTKKSAVSSETLDQLLNAFPIVEHMIDKDNDLKQLLHDYHQTEVVTMGYGEETKFEKLVRGNINQ